MADDNQELEPGGPEGPGGGDGRQRDVLSLAQLIGAPIHALVDAEAHSAMATARFIRSVGFTGTESGRIEELGDLQMASFRKRRRNAEGVVEEYEVQIPLLTLLPIPALQIRDAELEYVVKIIQTETMPSQKREMARNLQVNEALGLDPPAVMRAALAREPRPGDRRSVDMLLKMKVRIEQADMPNGLAKLLNLAGETVEQVLIPQEEDRPLPHTDHPEEE